MPTIALSVMQWDSRTGAEILATYPEENDIQEKTLWQLYSQHQFSGEAGFVSLSVGSKTVGSYYTGPESNLYIVLVLTSEDSPESYEEGLMDISHEIIKNASDDEALQKILPSLFHRLSIFPSLNEEQRLAIFYSNSLKMMILKRIREDVVIPKSEIGIWLRDSNDGASIDVDSLINDMVKIGVAKIVSVKEVSFDLIYLIQDLLLLRIPNANILKDPVGRHLPESLATAYKEEVRAFFSTYTPSEEDNLKYISEIILDLQVYEVIKLLREACVTKNDLAKLAKKGVEDADKVLKILWENKAITILKDSQGIEYYSLLSDFYIGKYFPHYLLDAIRTAYRNKSQNPKALIKALELLRDEYMITAGLKKRNILKLGKGDEKPSTVHA